MLSEFLLCSYNLPLPHCRGAYPVLSLKAKASAPFIFSGAGRRRQPGSSISSFPGQVPYPRWHSIQSFSIQPPPLWWLFHSLPIFHAFFSFYPNTGGAIGALPTPLVAQAPQGRQRWSNHNPPPWQGGSLYSQSSSIFTILIHHTLQTFMLLIHLPILMACNMIHP